MNKALKKRTMDNLDKWLEIILSNNDNWYYMSTFDDEEEFEYYDNLVVKNKKTPDIFSKEVLKYIVENLIEISTKLDCVIKNKYNGFDAHFLFAGIHYVASSSKWYDEDYEYSINRDYNDDIDMIYTFNYLYKNYK